MFKNIYQILLESLRRVADTTPHVQRTVALTKLIDIWNNCLPFMKTLCKQIKTRKHFPC